MAELDAHLVDQAVEEASKRSANLDYFFDNLSSPDWIEPLRERNLFSEPPRQIIDEEGYVRAPGWSASRYLARVAAAAPERVLTVIREISTDNERIHEDFVDAALAMPREQARVLALAEARWIANRDHIYYLLPRNAAELATRMAKLGELEPTVELIQGLFAPSSMPRDRGWGLKRPQARFSDWEYDQLLKKVVDGAVPEAPTEILSQLIDLLDQALKLMRDDDVDDEGFDTTSRIWRPRIADDRDRGSQVEDALISAVRDAARLIRQRGLANDKQVVDLLASRPQELFRRIAMDALAHGPKAELSAVHEFVVNPAELAGPEPSAEYRELLAAYATRLSVHDVETLVDAVRRGPDVEGYRERVRRYGESEPTDEDVHNYVAWWRTARLKFLEPALDDQQRAEYESLRDVAGDTELPISGEVRTFWGPTSPATADELAAKDDAELLAFLRDWDPESQWDAPSVEGLARTFAEFTQQHPNRTVALARGLREVRPAYVQAALQGLEGAVRDEERFAWKPVLELMRWVVEQPRELPEGRRDAYADLDPGWAWTRREIASLLELGLKTRDDSTIPHAFRADVWGVIEAIAADPDPTPEHEERYGGSNMDPATLALNTARPRAVHAAIAYAVWLHRHVQAPQKSADKPVPPLFEAAPEVPRLLEQHLDPEIDPSTAVRGAIGQNYVNLFVVDADWASRHAALVFPPDDSPLREAAWGAYVIYSRPFNDVFLALRSIYQRSAELVNARPHGFGWMNADPRSRLGEHLATFYWHGLIDLDDPVLTTYWDRAAPKALGDVMEFLGHSVRDTPELSEDVQERLLSFWEFAAVEAQRRDAMEALASFAWWFAATRLPMEWRITTLTDLLHRKIKPDPAFLVAKELPAIARNDPLSAVRAMRRLLEIEQEGWAIDAWKDEVQQVLREALEADEPEAQATAEETVHWLGALGYRGFRALVE